METANEPMTRPEAHEALSAETKRALNRAMVTARLLDERLAKLAGDGAIAFHPRASGIEGAVIGATAALRDGDWVFPTARDFGAALYRGMPIAHYLHRVFATSRDSLRGRAIPGEFSGRTWGFASASAPAATHLPHAVGFAWAARQRGEDVVTAAFFDGIEIDAADFHTGLNFAGVWKAPVVFVCRARAGQSAADYAIAYGLAHARCAGDVASVYRTVRIAVDRAIRGEGSTVVDVDVDAQDPLQSVQGESIDRAEIEREIEAAIAEAARTEMPARETMFDDVFAQRPPHLDDQAKQ